MKIRNLNEAEYDNDGFQNQSPIASQNKNEQNSIEKVPTKSSDDIQNDIQSKLGSGNYSDEQLKSDLKNLFTKWQNKQL